MKIKHRIPAAAYAYRTPIIDVAYQAELDKTLARAARRERLAEQRLHAAEHKLARLLRRPGPGQRHALLVARELIELRREELLAIQRLMQTIPASSQHRSRDAHRPIPALRTI
jgi:hypothetical protein